MISSSASRLVGKCGSVVNVVLKRNLAVSAVALQSKQATDPIQHLFLEKVREYRKKSEAAGGKLVDADDKLQRELDDALNRTLRQFGGKSHEEMSSFPSFNFPEPKLDPINIEQK